MQEADLEGPLQLHKAVVEWLLHLQAAQSSTASSPASTDTPCQLGLTESDFTGLQLTEFTAHRVRGAVTLIVHTTELQCVHLQSGSIENAPVAQHVKLSQDTNGCNSGCWKSLRSKEGWLMGGGAD